MVGQYKELRSSYEQKMARIEELDEIIKSKNTLENPDEIIAEELQNEGTDGEHNIRTARAIKELAENGKTDNKDAKRIWPKIRRRIMRSMVVLGVGVAGMGGQVKPKVDWNWNNVVDRTDYALSGVGAKELGSEVRRFAMKIGIYDSKNDEAVVVDADSSRIKEAEEQALKNEKQKVNNEKYKNDNTYTKILSQVPDGFNKGNKLAIYVNQYFNDDGFTYVPGATKKNSHAGDVYEGVQAVAHFMIMDDVNADLTNKTRFEDLQHAAQVFHNRIGHGVDEGEYVPVFQMKDDGKVLVRYKIAKDLHEGDLAITRLLQYKYSDINWDSDIPGTNYGFQSSIHMLAKNDGGASLSYLFTNAGKDAYSRFSGATVVFLFKDKFGNLIVRERSGSINQIKNEGLAISKEFGVPLDQITMGSYDAGSYTGKPLAKNGKIAFNQYSDYNYIHPNSASSLMIPEK